MHEPYLQHGPWLSVGLVAVLVVACWTDWRSNRIPNWLTLAGMVLGLGLRLAEGPSALVEGSLGFGLAVLVALPAFATGVLGGGDAKLLMAVGAVLGPRNFGFAVLAIAVAGGLLALAEALRRGMLRPALALCGATLLHWVTFGRLGPVPRPLAAQKVTVPYGLAIAAGTMVWWFLGGVS
ncbi:MAG TPA: A24 family peptidase [Gemmatimonadales bacterium]|jgi:prepilin peptidase CpaA|nr:A24 family peptidase [Gemmatimonadales bacterium]